jgi:hypothetical protein
MGLISCFQMFIRMSDKSNSAIHSAAEPYLMITGMLDNERLGTITIKYFNVCGYIRL